MQEALIILGDRLMKKAEELDTTPIVLISAFQVLHANEHLDRVLHGVEIDKRIYTVLLKNSLQINYRNAKQNLKHRHYFHRQSAENDLRAAPESTIEAIPLVSFLKNGLLEITQSNQLLNVHARSVVCAVNDLLCLKQHCNTNTATEAILTHCKDELQAFSDTVLMLSLDYSLQDIINVLSYKK